MWTYVQSTGKIYHDDTYVATGYSGNGPGRNNPALEHISNVGPLPQGGYTIGPAYNHPELGPIVMNLTRHCFTDGRDLFRIHGDNRNHDASHGCIILDRKTRELIAASSDLALIVRDYEGRQI